MFISLKQRQINPQKIGLKFSLKNRKLLFKFTNSRLKSIIVKLAGL